MTDHIDTAQERDNLSGLTGFTPGPWWTDAQYSGRQMGCSIIAANPNAGPMPGNPTRGQVAFGTAILNTEARKCEANSRLIAAAPDLLTTSHRLLDALDAERARAEKAEAEVARQKVALESQGKIIVDVAGVMDAMTPQFIEAIMPLIMDPMIATSEAATLRAEAERDQALARLAVVCTDRDAIAGAAYEACATAASIVDHATGEPETEFDRGYDQACRDNTDAIRNLTLADAQKALQRVVDAAWNEAVEACAAVFDTHGDSAATEALGQLLCCAGYMCGCQGATVGEYLEHLTRALKRPEASHE